MKKQEHSLLSPSGAHRWLNCPPSARLEAEEAQWKSSDYADEGTLAHALCALKLKQNFKRDTKEEEQTIEELSPRFYCGEMEEAADDYFRMVAYAYTEAMTTDPSAALYVEEPLDLTAYVKDCHGTADALIISKDCLTVYDFKYGRGLRVEAYDNPQLKIYALGALRLCKEQPANVRLVIAQPRNGGLSHWDTTPLELYTWAYEELVPTASLAYKGHGQQAAGPWCQFCKVAGTCRQAAANAGLAEAMTKEPGTLTPQEVAAILPRLAPLRKWAQAVEDAALSKALDGTPFPGLKLVDSSRAVRTITDPEAVAAALISQLDFEEEEVFKPKELKSLTALEKMAGPKKFADVCGPWIEKKAKNPSFSLVPGDDKRKEVSAAEAKRLMAVASMADLG